MNSKYRGIDIIEKAYITDLAMLYAHPSVKFVLEAPYDYVVYEFADELSEFLRKEEKKGRYELRKNPDIRRKLKEIYDEKRFLLKPFYEHPQACDSYGYETTHSIGFSFVSEEQTRHFHYVQPGVSGRKKYVGIDCSGINHYTNKILIIAKFKKTTPKIKQKYEEIVSVWLDWLKHHNKLETNDIRVDYEEDLGKFKIAFKDNFEDYLAVFPIIVNSQLGFKSIYDIVFHNFED